MEIVCKRELRCSMWMVNFAMHQWGVAVRGKEFAHNNTYTLIHWGAIKSQSKENKNESQQKLLCVYLWLNKSEESVNVMAQNWNLLLLCPKQY